MNSMLPTLLLLVLLYALAAMFCCLETAFTVVNRAVMQNLAEQGDRRAQLVVRLLNRAGQFFGTVLLGTNLVQVTITTLVRSILVLTLLHTRALQVLLRPFADRQSGFEDLLTTLLVMPTLLLFTEMIPKAIGRNHAVPVCLVLARPLNWLRKIMRLPVLALDYISSGMARAVCQARGVQPRTMVTRDDLKMLAEVAMEQGLVREEAGNMLQAVLELDTRPVATVMVPLVDVQAVPMNATVTEVEQLAANTGFSRFPVYEGRVDNVIGIVSLRQCLYGRPFLGSELSPGKPSSLGIASFVNTNVLFAPESKSVSALLDELRYQHVPMAVIVDEHGGVVGIITIEDLVAQVVGGIHDARTQKIALIRKVTEEVFECDGKTDIRELEEETGLVINNQGFETVAGLVLKIAGRIPREKEKFHYAGYEIEVLSMRRRRIRRLRWQKMS